MQPRMARQKAGCRCVASRASAARGAAARRRPQHDRSARAEHRELRAGQLRVVADVEALQVDQPVQVLESAQRVAVQAQLAQFPHFRQRPEFRDAVVRQLEPYQAGKDFQPRQVGDAGVAAVEVDEPFGGANIAVDDVLAHAVIQRPVRQREVLEQGNRRVDYPVIDGKSVIGAARQAQGQQNSCQSHRNLPRQHRSPAARIDTIIAPTGDHKERQWMSEGGAPATDGTINIVQRGNLKTIETTLRKQWRLGQNIVLCWSATDNGILLLMVPHYFLGNYTAGNSPEVNNSKESFVRQLISGRRRKERNEFFEVSERLGVSANFIKLSTPLVDEPAVNEAIEEIVRRYGLSYVSNRAVILIDIAQFSLFTPFEQASQLNSLSYSMNSAYNKLLTRGIDVNFARTTTGDGYYVWNRDLSPGANEDLLHFLTLVIADNAMARKASKGNTVPLIRTAFHIGSHYELYQAEGVNPTVFSYIVGDVTIELARMVDLARPGQIFIGSFQVELPSPGQEDPDDTVTLDTLGFLDRCNADVERMLGIQVAGQEVKDVRCEASVGEGEDGKSRPRRFRLTDKHGISRSAYNLELDFETSGGDWSMGLSVDQLDASDEAEGENGESPSSRKAVVEE